MPPSKFFYNFLSRVNFFIIAVSHSSNYDDLGDQQFRIKTRLLANICGIYFVFNYLMVLLLEIPQFFSATLLLPHQKNRICNSTHLKKHTQREKLEISFPCTTASLVCLNSALLNLPV